MNKLTRKLGIILVLIGLIAVSGVVIANNRRQDKPIVFSDNAMLSELYKSYLSANIEPGSHRTLDKQNNNITTSEGQSYTMFRAVSVDDRTTFDQSLQWTKDNLQRDSDQLFSWKFGKHSDGSYGILNEIGGENTASDADTDIALSLVMGYSRWNDDKYLGDARVIIDDIWSQEVVTINGKPVLVANNLEKDNKDSVLINPSYWSPASYKIFAKIDPSHDWEGLRNNTYDLLKQVGTGNLDKSSSNNMPPDWARINRKTGAITAATGENISSNYSYDAMRTPWRLALDWQWFHDKRDKEVLSQYSFLSTQWEQNHKLAATYTHDGKMVGTDDAPAVYGGDIGYFVVMDESAAKEIYEQKLESLYNPDKQSWRKQLSYYDDNWAWFGIALYNKDLVNITSY